jgi:hypothetical protein
MPPTLPSPLTTPGEAHQSGLADRLVSMSEQLDCHLPSKESLVDAHLEAILDQATALCALNAGWNGSDALPVNQASAAHAVRLAAKVTCPECLAPHLSPTVDGNVMLDWTWADEHVEIEVFADGRIEGHLCVGSIEREFSSDVANESALQWLAHQITGVGIARLTPPA